MQVPFVDLKKQYSSIKPEIDKAIKDVIEKTAFIGGEYVQKFEDDFANLLSVKHCISVANGTDSLYILMRMLNIGPGDEVITVANSWISTSETISQTGAKPVFVDIHPEYYTINEELIEDVINENTKAIIPVHLYGQVCNMDRINKLAEKYNLTVLEDCAQSHLSEFSARLSGTMGLAGSFSFYPGKNLGAYGDAGAIVTNDDELAIRCRMFARHGAIKKHHHLMEGINSRMDGLQASILLAKLPFLKEWTELRIKAAKYYQYELADLQDIVLPVVRADSRHTFHLFVIRAKQRNELIHYLRGKGVETAIHYPTALPNQPAYEYLHYSSTDFPVATQYQSEILSLPMFPEITEEQIKYVADCIKAFYS